MRGLSFLGQVETPVVLCVGAHCDDIEIGCAGTLLLLREAYPAAEIHWMILASDEKRRLEALRSARLLLGDDGASRVAIKDFRDTFLPYEGARVKECFEALKPVVDPDVIFTHCRHDRHQDHRLVSDLTWNTWRSHLILEYEIPKYDGDLGQPNSFVPLDASHVSTKWATLQEAYVSQRDRDWFDEETFRGLMRLRGVECGAASGYAEAFFARKLVLEL
jgi:LmbE family N-acetylglucosaminyl deacetylase